MENSDNKKGPLIRKVKILNLLELYFPRSKVSGHPKICIVWGVLVLPIFIYLHLSVFWLHFIAI